MIIVNDAKLISQGKSVRLHCLQPGLGLCSTGPVQAVDGNIVTAQGQTYFVQSWRI